MEDALNYVLWTIAGGVIGLVLYKVVFGGDCDVA